MVFRFALGRLGFSGRIVLIVLLTMIAGLTLGTGFSFMAREKSNTRETPLPAQVAAVVGLLEQASPKQRKLVLRAVNTTDVRVIIKDKSHPQASSANRLPAVEWILSQHLQNPDRHEVIATLANDQPPGLIYRFVALFSPLSKAPLTIDVSMTSGEHAVFETRGSPASRIFGFPPGFWIGTLGAVLALFAVRAVMREAKPLQLLETSLTQFSKDAGPRHVPPAGAPDLRQLIKTTNAMQERISALIKARSVLMASISHDLRTFLTRLRLRIEMVPDDTQRAKAVSDLDDMTTLLEDAVIIARGEAVPERRQIVDVGTLARTEVSNRANSRIELIAATDTNTANVEGDPIALRRLLANLIDNALRYADHVVVRLEPSAKTVSLIVDDDGPGIPPNERAAVLEPFYRLDPSRTKKTGGSGLGLAIVKQIADAHGATITLETSPLGGARFQATFPTTATHKA